MRETHGGLCPTFYPVNFMANDQAALLLPNRWQAVHRYENQPLVFPAPGCGVCLEMRPAPGEAETAEAFLALVFPEPLDLAEALEPGLTCPWRSFIVS